MFALLALLAIGADFPYLLSEMIEGLQVCLLSRKQAYHFLGAEWR